ncbi:MAG: hypothetical protein SF162_02685 [bacterium]|nr:hypothetical protein [bacterium]
MAFMRQIFSQSADVRLRWSLFCILLSVYLIVYVDVPDSLDSEAILAVSAAWVRTGSPDMNAIAYTDWIMPPSAGMGRTGIDGATYSKKGIVPSLALMPLVIAAESAHWLTTRATAMFFNPLVTALTACVLYTLSRRLRFRPRTAFTIGLLYGLATLALVYTKTLFAEPLAALLLMVAAVHVHRFWSAAKAADALVIGLTVGLLIGINTIYGLYAPLFGLALIASPTLSLRPREHLVRGLLQGAAFSLPVIGALVLLMAFNAARFGEPLEGGYRFSEGEGFIHPLTTGLYGLFLSPYRGLFWYNPLLLLAIPGAVMLLRSTHARRFLMFVLAVIAAQALMFASWWSWHGGVVWGTRFLVPIAPLATLLIAPLIDAAWMRRHLWGVIGVFAVLSVFVQALGALFSVFPHYAYLTNQFYTGDPFSPVTELDTQIFIDPRLSPIIGHLALLAAGWPLEPVALRAADAVHTGAAALVLLYGVWRLSRPRTDRISAPLGIALVLVVLNGVGARRAGSPEVQRILALDDALQPPASILAYTTAFGSGALDLEGQRAFIALNAPVDSEDRLALSLVNFALRRYDRLWFMTWYPPADAQNWLEMRLTGHYVGRERTIDGHRAIEIAPAPTLEPQFTPSAPGRVNIQFGPIRLAYICIQPNENGTYVDLLWQTYSDVQRDYQWFAHLIDQQGTILEQLDRQPRSGFAPTSGWEPMADVEGYRRYHALDGRIDRLYFAPNRAAAALRIGWVDPATAGRLPVAAPLFSGTGVQAFADYVVFPLDTCPESWMLD